MSLIDRVSSDVIKNHIHPYLDNRDLVNFSTCSKKVMKNEKLYDDKKIKEINKKAFIESTFGTIAQCEKDIPLDKLEKNLQFFSKIKTTLRIEKDIEDEYEAIWANVNRFDTMNQKARDAALFLNFDNDGNISFKGYDYLFKDLTFFKKMKAKYRFFRGEHHKKTHDEVRKIFEHQATVAKEFNDNRVTGETTNSLCEFRNRIFRIKGMTEAQRALYCAMESSKYAYLKFIKSLNILEFIVFKIISLFQSILKKAYNVKQQIVFQALGTNFQEYNSHGVKCGETTYTENGVQKRVEIIANFGSTNSKEFSGSTIFRLKLPNSDTELGYLKIKRCWHESAFKIHSEDSLYIPTKLQPEKRFLDMEVEYIGRKTDGDRDPMTGDLPIPKLLCKIAVEVFNRETDKRLMINTGHRDCQIFIAGGFDYLNNREKVLQNITTARDNGKLYPEYKDYTSSTATLYKNIDLINKHNTQFAQVFSPADRQEKPALVDFEMGQDPITWEREIAERPLLKGVGPILPRYLKKNLYKYEK